MVNIDSKRDRLVNSVANLKMELECAEFSLHCYDHQEKLTNQGLSQGKAYAFGTLDDVLVSEKPVERCVFDNSRLEMIAPIISGSSGDGKEITPTTIYQCKKCKVRYISPLTEKDDKDYRKRMQEMVFG